MYIQIPLTGAVPVIDTNTGETGITFIGCDGLLYVRWDSGYEQGPYGSRPEVVLAVDTSRAQGRHHALRWAMRQVADEDWARAHCERAWEVINAMWSDYGVMSDANFTGYNIQQLDQAIAEIQAQSTVAAESTT